MLKSTLIKLFNICCTYLTVFNKCNIFKINFFHIFNKKPNTLHSGIGGILSKILFFLLIIPFELVINPLLFLTYLIHEWCKERNVYIRVGKKIYFIYKIVRFIFSIKFLSFILLVLFLFYTFLCFKFNIPLDSSFNFNTQFAIECLLTHKKISKVQGYELFCDQINYLSQQYYSIENYDQFYSIICQQETRCHDVLNNFEKGSYFYNNAVLSLKFSQDFKGHKFNLDAENCLTDKEYLALKYSYNNILKPFVVKGKLLIMDK